MKTAAQLGYVMCHDCHSLNDGSDEVCYRCNGALNSRQPNSLHVSWAWLVTAVLMIIPANIYPITVINKFGVLQPDTIASGVMSLVEMDMVPIAIIVFIASIVVPGIKVIGLFYIFLSIHMKAPVSHKTITHMFHFIEWIGRWSMLDLFVISIMVVLLDVGQVSFEAGPATVAFGLVVFSTMLSAKAFDSRLLWDREKV
jgi:paraquat-inducible protein A